MNNKPGNVLQNTIQSVFENDGLNKFTNRGKNRKCTGAKRELELALTVLLVDLASCDQNFDQQEYALIVSALQRMFGTPRQEIQALVNQANMALANLRGVNQFATLLNEQLSHEKNFQRLQIVNGFDTYHNTI